MSFYGNITNTSRSPFTFDRIYPNRVQMENACATDGVFAGRYVLVEYDKEFSNKGIMRFYRKEEDNSAGTGDIKLYKDIECLIPVNSIKVGDMVVVRETDEINTGKFLTNDQINRIRNFYYAKGELLEGDYFCDITETVDDEVIISRIYFDESAMIVQNIDPSTQQTELANIEIMKEKEILFSYYRCETKPTVENPYNTFTLVSDSNVNNQAKSLQNYLTNAKVDYGEYKGTFDSTVWEKIYIGEDEQYIRVANLNSRFPSLTVSADAPSENPIPPHFDSAGLGETYNLHIQTQWGLRVAAADGALSTHGMIKDDEGDYVTKKNYLKDKLGNIIDSVIGLAEKNEETVNKIITPIEEDLKAKVYSKIDLSKFKILVLGSTSLSDDKSKIIDEYSVSLLKDSYKSDEDITWSNSNGEKDFTASKKENGELVWVEGENGKYPGAIYYNKAGFDSANRNRADDEEDYVSLESTGFSQIYDEETQSWINQPYNDEDNIIVGSKTSAPDTKEIRINLPSVGNTISDVWDLTYGKERNKTVEWDKNDGLRMVTPNEDVDTGYNYTTEAVSTIAGCINSVQDLMGKIIKISNESFATLGQEDITALSYDNIYYSSVDKKFYYKEDCIDFKADYSAEAIKTKEDYENKVQGYTEVSLTDKNNINKDYFYKDGADYVYNSVGDIDKKYYKIESKPYNISINEDYYKQVGASFRKLREHESLFNDDVFRKISDKDFEDQYFAYVRNKFFIKTTNGEGKTVYRKSTGSFNAKEDYYLLRVDSSSIIIEDGEVESGVVGTLEEFKVYHGRSLILCESSVAYDSETTYYFLPNNTVCPKRIQLTEDEYKQKVAEKTIYFCNNISASQLKMLNPEAENVYISSQNKGKIETYKYSIVLEPDIDIDKDSGYFKILSITDSSKYSEDYAETPIFYRLKTNLSALEKNELNFTSSYRLVDGKRYQKVNNETSIGNNEQLYEITATPLNLKFYKPYTYFIKDETGFYNLCEEDNYNPQKTYYSSAGGKYIVTNSYGGYHAGQIWDNSIKWNGEISIDHIPTFDDQGEGYVEGREYYDEKELINRVVFDNKNDIYAGIKAEKAVQEPSLSAPGVYTDWKQAILQKGKTTVFWKRNDVTWCLKSEAGTDWITIDPLTTPMKPAPQGGQTGTNYYDDYFVKGKLYAKTKNGQENPWPLDPTDYDLNPGSFKPNQYWLQSTSEHIYLTTEISSTFAKDIEIKSGDNNPKDTFSNYGQGLNIKYYLNKNGKTPVIPYLIYSEGQFWYDKAVVQSLTTSDIVLNCKLVAEQDLITQQRVKELIGFAYNYNTIHGLILRLNRILREGDMTTRDISTVQGALNRLNDEISRIGSYNLSTLQVINDKIDSFKKDIKDLQNKVNDAQKVLQDLRTLLGNDLSVQDILTVKNYKDKLYNFYTINEQNYNPVEIIELLYNKIKKLEDFIAEQFNGNRGLSDYNIGYREMRFIADMEQKKRIPIFDYPEYGEGSLSNNEMRLLAVFNTSKSKAGSYDIIPYILINKNFRKQKVKDRYRVSNIVNNSFYTPVQSMIYIDISWTDYPDYKNKGKSNVKDSKRVWQKTKTWITFFTLKEVKPLKNQSLNLTVNIQENTDLTGECFIHTDGTIRCRYDKKYKANQSMRVRGWVLIEPVTDGLKPALVDQLEFSPNTLQVSQAEKERLKSLVEDNKIQGNIFTPYSEE